MIVIFSSCLSIRKSQLSFDLEFTLSFSQFRKQAFEMNKHKSDEPIGYSVEGVLALAGGRGAVAAKTGVSIQTVAKWARRIPGPHARTVAIMAGLPLEIVRPDLVRHA